jgi:hypothetical protein
MSVQTPFVHTAVLVCWQSASTEQSCACVLSHAITHAGVPVPPSAPHVWQQEFGASHEVAPHTTLWAPRSASLEPRLPSVPELDRVASDPAAPELELELETPELETPELEPEPPALDIPELELVLEGAAPALGLDTHPAPPASVANAIANGESRDAGKATRRSIMGSPSWRLARVSTNPFDDQE